MKALPPNSEACMLASHRVGLRYWMSRADDILSPYFASKPPDEKPTFSTMSALMTDRPSCCPLRISRGRYTSTLLIYTEFSSNEPPRTLYCDDSSLWVETPACCCTSSSTALPVVDGVCRKSFVSNCSVLLVCLRRSVTTTSSSAFMACSVTSSFWLPRGRRSTRVLVW